MCTLQLFRDLRAFIYESSKKAGTRRDLVLHSRDAKGHNTNIMILFHESKLEKPVTKILCVLNFQEDTQQHSLTTAVQRT